MAEIEVHEISFIRLEERQYLKKLEDFIGDLLSAIDSVVISIGDITSYLKKSQLDSKLWGNERPPPNPSQDSGLLHTAFMRQQHEALQYQKQLLAVQQKVTSVSSLVRKPIVLRADGY